MNLQQQKLSRIAVINDILEKARIEKRVIIEDKMIAQLCLKWGSSMRTLKEYLDTLEMAEKIIRKKGEVWLI